MSKVRIYQKPAGIPANTSVFAVEILQNNVWYTRKVSWETIKGLIAGAESLVFDAGTLTFTTPDGIAHQVLSVDSEVIPNSANPVSGEAVNTALAGKQDTLTFDQVPTDGSTNPVESNGIYDALALKQNTLTFDNAPTDGSTNPVTSQGIYAAISAVTSGIDWKEAVATYADIATTYPNPEDGWTVTTLDDDHTYRYNGTAWVDLFSLITLATSTKDGLMSSADFSKLAGIEAEANKTTAEDITDVVVDLTDTQQTASANPITLETKQAGLAKSCVVEMNPIQDLHGYDHPWVGGAGKNKFQTTATSQTISGTEFTVNNDGSVTIKNTPSETATLYFGVQEIPAGTYKANGFSGGASNNIRLVYFDITHNVAVAGIYQNRDIEFTLSETSNIRVYPIIPTQYDGVEVTMYPMIRLATESDATFAPYSNICPISGRTEASVTRTGKNEIDEDFLLLANGWTKSDGEYSGSNMALHAPFSGGYSGDIKFRENTQYTVSFDFKADENKTTVFGFKYSDGTISQSFLNNTTYERKNFTSTINKTVVGIIFSYGSVTTVHIKEFQLELGSTATAYEPYTAETKTKEFGQTVFGGVYNFFDGGLSNEWSDNKVLLSSLTWTKFPDSANYGTLYYTDGLSPYINTTDQTKIYTYCDIFKSVTNSGHDGRVGTVTEQPDNTLRINATKRIYIRCESITTVEDFETLIATHDFVYVKATPTTIQLSPEAVTLLKGLNIISTDGDKVQVEFSDIPVGDYSTILDYVKSLEARIEALEGGN